MTNKPEWRIHLEERIKTLTECGCNCDINPEYLQEALDKIDWLESSIKKLMEDSSLKSFAKRESERADSNGRYASNMEVELMKAKAEIKLSYQKGLEEGLRMFAWWKDGVQYVGTCGTTLAEALKEINGKGNSAG